jgi:hypothetical protein
MEGVLYIYIFLIIISVLFIIYYFKNKKTILDETNEHFKFKNCNKNNKLNIYTKDYLHNKFSSEPNLNIENGSQFNYERLFNKLQLINNEKIELKGPLNEEKYIVSTIDDKLRRDLDNITKYVLLILNQDNYYDFAKTNYGDLKVYYNKKNDSNYIFELFLWDKKNFFEIKLLINIIKIPKKNYLYKFGIKDKHYIFNDYNIGIPSKDQLIPLPLDVIPTQNGELNDEIFKNEPLKPKYFYLNQIKIQNSTLIVDYEKNNFYNGNMNVNEKTFSGITDQTIEYMNYKGNNNPIMQKSKTYNKWPVLDDMPKWKGQYPAKTPPQSWDVDGIYYYSKVDKEIASSQDEYSDMYDSGTIWSPMKMPLQPYSRPTLATVPRNCGENYWLFNAVGPQGTFFGGGKG